MHPAYAVSPSSEDREDNALFTLSMPTAPNPSLRLLSPQSLLSIAITVRSLTIGHTLSTLPTPTPSLAACLIIHHSFLSFSLSASHMFPTNALTSPLPSTFPSPAYGRLIVAILCLPIGFAVSSPSPSPTTALVFAHTSAFVGGVILWISLCSILPNELAHRPISPFLVALFFILGIGAQVFVALLTPSRLPSQDAI